jgi:AraC-like DNA-binding protein
MSIYLANNFENRIEFQNGLPQNYHGPLLRGSKTFHSVNNSFQLVMQEIVTELYLLRLNVFRFFETLSLDSMSDKTGIHSRMLLKGNLQHKIKGTGKIYLREGEFTMLWAESAECYCRFENNTEYSAFDIFYSPKLLEQLTFFFPELKDLMKEKKPKLIVKNPCFVTPSMKDIIRQILECPYDETTRQFYFDLKVREYLYVMLQHAYKRPPSRYRFTPYETACIIKAHKLILEDLSKKPLSLQMLSRAVAINEFKLKAGFKQIFGLSIFDCIHESRMEKARGLLLSTDMPIKQICVLTGYARMTNFITAFRKKFGYTPGSLRRK